MTERQTTTRTSGENKQSILLYTTFPLYVVLVVGVVVEERYNHVIMIEGNSSNTLSLCYIIDAVTIVVVVSLLKDTDEIK
jgi:hypothetical protein